MPVMVTCPECRDRYEVSDEAAVKLIRCRRCQCPIDADRQDVPADAIEADVAPLKVHVPHQHEDEDDRALDDPLTYRSPRAPFPWTAILIVVIGVLFFLLAFSVAFNVWFLTRPDRRFGQHNENPVPVAFVAPCEGCS